MSYKYISQKLIKIPFFNFLIVSTPGCTFLVKDLVFHSKMKSILVLNLVKIGKEVHDFKSCIA